jgi:hypothetical protein
LVVSFLTLINYFYAKENPGGNDFLVHWMGTRNFFETGASPYSEDTALKIQTMVYGRAAQAGEHQLRVAYPLYSIFLLAPFAIFKDFNFARALWMSLLELCLFGMAYYSLDLTYWKPKKWLLAAFLVFTLISYHGIRPLINGNAVILITFCIVLILKAIRDKKDEVAGLLLALVTIKPQNVILLIIFVLIWAALSKRTKIIGWFIGTMIILFGFSFLLVPDWITQNLREIIRYPSYNPEGSIGAVLATKWGAIGTRISYGITIIFAGLLLLEWWIARHSEIRHFLWAAFLTIAVSQWIGIQTDPGNFILLYPGVFYCFYLIKDRWGNKATTFFVILLGAITVSLWILFIVTLNHSYQPIQSPVMFFPMPFIAFILLYWVRWWVKEAKRVELNKRNLEF